MSTIDQLINCENWIRITILVQLLVHDSVIVHRYLVVITVFCSMDISSRVIWPHKLVTYLGGGGVTGTLGTRFGNFEDLFKANFPGQVLKVPKICAQIYFNNFSEAGC